MNTESRLSWFSIGLILAIALATDTVVAQNAPQQAAGAAQQPSPPAEIEAATRPAVDETTTSQDPPILEPPAVSPQATLWAQRLSKDNPGPLRTLAANALATLLTTENAPDEIIVSLTSNVRDQEADELTRRAAASALGKIRSPKALDALVGVIADEKEPAGLRAVVCRAVAEIGVRVSDVQPIVRQMSNRQLHQPLVLALAQQGESILLPLASEMDASQDPVAREGIAKVFATMSNPELRSVKFPLKVDYLYGLLAGSRETDAFRQQIATSLSNAGSDSVPTLREKLTADSADNNTRVRVAKILGGVGPEAASAIAPLTSMLLEKDSPVWVHDAAAGAIAQIGAPVEATPALLVSLTHVDSVTRENVIISITRNGPSCLPILIEAISNPDVTPAIKQGAMESAYVIGTESKSTVGVDAMVHILGKGLRDENREVVMSSLSWLGRLGAEAAIALPEIRRLRENAADRTLIRAIDRTLNQIGPSSQSR